MQWCFKLSFQCSVLVPAPLPTQTQVNQTPKSVSLASSIHRTPPLSTVSVYLDLRRSWRPPSPTSFGTSNHFSTTVNFPWFVADVLTSFQSLIYLQSCEWGSGQQGSRHSSALCVYWFPPFHPCWFLCSSIALSHRYYIPHLALFNSPLKLTF